MKEFILGTAGHVDHGKTSLVKALTGIDTDRLKEEKERGITIELGFAHLDLPCGVRLGIVDVPGHERFVKNMVAGASGMDLVALVIAADEGVMPQTREHMEICTLLGIESGLVIVTKRDMVEPDWLDLVEEEIRDYLKGSFLEGAPLVSVSSVTGEGITAARDVINRMVAAREQIQPQGPFRLPVDRVFTMKGFGTVITGTSISGRIKVGENIFIYPQELAAKIRGIQVHGQDVEEAEAGSRTAINIQGLEREMIERGNVIATPECLAPSYVLDCDFLYLGSSKKNLKNRARVRVHLGTDEVIGRIALLEHDELTPGDFANVQLLLEKTIAVWPGDRYVVRSYSPVHTLGGGKVLNANTRKRRRLRKDNAAIFEVYHTGSPEDLAILHLRDAGLAGLTMEQLAVKLAVFGKPLKKIMDPPISTRKIVVIPGERSRLLASGVYEDVKNKAVTLLTAFHKQNPLLPGFSKEELRTRLAYDLDPRLFQFLLTDLIKQGTIAQDQAVIRLANHRVSLKEDEARLRKALEELYSKAGLAPPTVKETLENFAKLPADEVKEMMAVLVREGVLVKVKEDLYFPGPQLADLEARFTALLKKEGEIDAGGFKNLTGLTRKFSIPLMEYFDRMKLTIRVGDKRVLRERAGT